MSIIERRIYVHSHKNSVFELVIYMNLTLLECYRMDQICGSLEESEALYYGALQFSRAQPSSR